MAISNHERVVKAMVILKAGLGPFVERECRAKFEDRTSAEVARLLGDDRPNARKPILALDVAARLKVMWELRDDIFRLTLGQTERSLVNELRDHRDRWAHREAFSGDDS